jgi:predicted outer membrane repeat protein
MNGDVFGPNATADKNGGALFWCGKNGTIEDCNFINNKAEYGGGIYFNSTATDSKIIHCTFDSNNATKNGGAIDCNATEMTLTHTTFTENTAQYGAALCREANANGGSGYDNTFIANHALIAGAALGWMNSSKISIDTYFFYDNYADEMGGAIYVGNGSGECEILNCEFERNYVVNATGHGGAIDWFATKGTINNTRFTDNWAHEGGAVYIHTSSGNITINNTNFIKNKAVNGFGGAINLEASAITVNKTNFIENVANEGGAIYAGGKGTTNSFYYCLFDGNVANAT